MKQNFYTANKLLAVANVFFVASNFAFAQSPKNLPDDFDHSVKKNPDGTIFVAFQNNGHIYFSKSTDGGKNFNPGVQVDKDLMFQVQWEKPFVSVEFGHIYVSSIFRKTNPESIFVPVRFISYDSGQAFSANYGIGGVYLVQKKPPSPTNVLDPGNGPVPGGIKGSFDLDTFPTIFDAGILLNAVFFAKRFLPNSAFWLGGADVNCDGSLSAADVVIELNAVFLGTPITCPPSSPSSR